MSTPHTNPFVNKYYSESSRIPEMKPNFLAKRNQWVESICLHDVTDCRRLCTDTTTGLRQCESIRPAERANLMRQASQRKVTNDIWQMK
jgi:hypothetical protein